MHTATASVVVTPFDYVPYSCFIGIPVRGLSLTAAFLSPLFLSYPTSLINAASLAKICYLNSATALEFVNSYCWVMDRANRQSGLNDTSPTKARIESTKKLDYSLLSLSVAIFWAVTFLSRYFYFESRPSSFSVSWLSWYFKFFYFYFCRRSFLIST